MILLVSGATATVRACPSRHVGTLIVPAAQNRPATLGLADRVWAMDNGAFSRFNPRLFERMLWDFRRIRGCRFVCAPDVVGNARQTLQQFQEWAPVIRQYGYPVALVGQDGLTLREVPWCRLDAFFVGGSTEWKLSRTTRTLVAYAQALGKWVHMGRVNSLRRLTYAAEIGCHSVDGTSYSRFPRVRLPRVIQHLETLPWREG